MALHASLALLPAGWAENVRIEIGDDGHIRSAVAGVEPGPSDLRLEHHAILPAVANLHSHAFQRAMAGLAERRSHESDDFWGWRTLMYAFLAQLDPEAMEAIAALAQIEMLEAGYAAVGEFHYVHNRPDGGAYDNPAELAVRIMAAAETTGIGLAMLPVFYANGGAGGAAPTEGQRRFATTLDGFLDLHERIRIAASRTRPDCVVGIAPHSLRATTPESLRDLTDAVRSGPVHIHAAEQTREVDEIAAWLGKRPVGFLLDEIGIGERWCLIHATHMTPAETSGLARSGAVAGLCPITEANLGDGIFNAPRYREDGGRIGIGTDSNVQISLAGELRLLEYGRRLQDRRRSVLCEPGGSTGEWLYRAALAGGAQALQRRSGKIARGRLGDLVALDLDHVAFAGARPDDLLDRWIFASGAGAVGEVFSAGRHMVRSGRHIARASVVARYRAAIDALRTDL